MKNKIILIAGFLILALSGILSANHKETKDSTPDGAPFSIVSTPELYNLVIKWTSEYKKVNPAQEVALSAQPAAALMNYTLPGNGLKFISGDNIKNWKTNDQWQITVGRDAVVPVINASNPLLYMIRENGISADKLARVVSDRANRHWGALLSTTSTIPLNVYLPYNSQVVEKVAAFLNLPVSTINYITCTSEKELIQAIQKDPNGIGFTKIIDVFNLSDQSLPENIALMPIDKNGNGKLDYSERIYDNWQSFLRGVWIGKYPHVLCQNIYLVANSKPENKAELDFLKWVVSSGQVYLNDYGYFDLVYSDRQTELEKLSKEELVINSASGANTIKAALIFMAALIFIGLFVTVSFSYYRGRRHISETINANSISVFDSKTVQMLDGLYFDRSHTWSFMEKSGQVRVGIDDFLQHVTGTLTCVKMKKTGEKVRKGDVFVSIIQDGKRLNIKSPISGIVKEHNDFLIMNSHLVNTSPFSDGWIYLIEPSNWLKEMQSLIMGDRYKLWINNELTRLKDFLATSLKAHNIELSAIALQDGGPLTDHVLSEFGPEVWDDFQTNYLDTAI